MQPEIIQEPDLRRFEEAVFLAMGCSLEHAQQATDVLMAADLRGIDSHGCARLDGYVRLWKEGRINTKPHMKVVREKGTNINLDADGALGLISAPYAMNIAIERCTELGSGFVAVQNSNHFGIAAYHAMKALDYDFIGYAMTNASPLVAPNGSKEMIFGTNPICYAVPTKNEMPFVADFATSAAANGKLQIAQRTNKDIPLGWAQNSEGQNTNSAFALKDGGSLLPLGSFEETGSHKGFALAAQVDIFTAVLSGAAYGKYAPPFVDFLPLIPLAGRSGLGHFLGAWDVDGFIDKEQFKEDMDAWIKHIKSSKTNNSLDSLIVPGEPEFINHQKNIKEGLHIHSKVFESLIELDKKFGIKQFS